MIKKLNNIFYMADGSDAGGAANDDNTVIMTDPITQQPVKVPKELETFIGHVATSNRKGGKAAVKNDLDAANDQVDELKAELADLRTKIKNAGAGDKQVEAQKAEYEKIIAEMKKATEKTKSEAESWRAQFEEHKIMNDINAALTGYDLYNPQQTIDLIRAQGRAKLTEKIDLATGAGTGQYETKLTLNLPDESGAMRPVELGAGDAIKKFFAVEGNAFHLKNKLNPGGGSTGSNLNMPGAGSLEARYNEAMKTGNLMEAIKAKQEIYEKRRT
jgi:hypothetical protein